MAQFARLTAKHELEDFCIDRVKTVLIPLLQPSLLFAGLAYRQAAWLDLWRKLDPDPLIMEVTRNYPIRQPVLALMR